MIGPMTDDVAYLRRQLARYEEVLRHAIDYREERNRQGSVTLQERIAMATVVDTCQEWVVIARRHLAQAERVAARSTAHTRSGSVGDRGAFVGAPS